MEVCTHCKIYMKPFVNEDHCTCEFCGGVVARKIDGKWERIILPD